MDDTLHARLKARAAAEGRSLNDLVNCVLAAAVDHRLSRQELLARADAVGQLVRPPAPANRPSREQVLESTRGLGCAASEALEADRGSL
jgi:plasmid stability protein